MYAQVRHPWRTRPVALYRKAELVLLAPSSSQYFVYLPLSIQRPHARSKYTHVCSGAPSWRTRPVRVIPKGELALLAPSSQLPAPSSRLSALGSRLSALGSRLSALG